MQKIKFFYISALILLLGLGACNSTYEQGESTASSVAVYAFSIRSSNNALAGIDTVFFSIDLVNAKIFNADSLPYGTNITRIIPTIKTLEGLSACEFYVKRPGLTDTVYNYMTNPSDSIDFTNCPVRLRVVSPDASVERFYDIFINVHKVKSDSLEWAVTSRSALPTSLSAPTASGSAMFGEMLYCAASDIQGNYSIARTSDPYTRQWEQISEPFAGLESVDVTSLRGGETALYVLDNDGNMYSSTDGASTWTPSGRKYVEIFGELFGKPVGTGKDADGQYGLVDPESGSLMPLPSAKFPVSGASAGVNYSFAMSTGRQMVILGGRASDGSLSDAAWTFDGKSWLNVTQSPLPEKLEGLTVVPYTTFDGSIAWDANKYPSLLAFGGKNADGKVSSKVYVSRDYGMIWREADELLQLPDYLTPTWALGGFTINHLTKDSDPESDLLRIFAPQSRVTEAITEWEVPYIYLIGGMTATGEFSPWIWCGAINRLTFKPLY